MLICQISDPHVVAEGELAYGRVDTARMLARCVQQIGAMAPAPDVLIATGDLTDHGSAGEYEMLAALLAPLSMPVYLLAGNHDERRALQAAFPGQRHLCGEDGFVQYAVDDWPLRLVVLDTVVPGSDGGRLCARRLQWLQRTLAADHRPTVVAQHHPPLVSGLTAMDAQTLANAHDEAVVIGRHRHVERIICGHYHRSFHARFAGTIASVCASTAQQLALELTPGAGLRLTYEPPSFQLHLWTGESLVSHTAVVGDYQTWSVND